MVLFIIIFCLLVVIGLGVLAAVSDWRGLLIPNAYSLGIILAFIPAYAAFLFFAGDSGYFQGWASHLGAFAILFIGSFILFTLNMFGAGDSKLATAFALWVGLEGLGAFVFYMALVGGLLGLVTLGLRKYKPFAHVRPGTWFARAQAGDNVVPYGIAITAGAIAAFFWLGYADLVVLHQPGGTIAP